MPSKVNEVIARTGSRLIVGLDPDPGRLPAHYQAPDKMTEYLEKIIEATSDLVCGYKPNLAFFEALGEAGTAMLKAAMERIPKDVLVIGDGKRGDIGNTSARYAKALFERDGFSATTLNPLMGRDCIEPFLKHRDRTCFLLCLTSNPGADDFLVPEKLYARIARKAMEWNREYGNVGLVVGATRPEYVAEIRAIAATEPFLIPGVGAQGGAIEEVVQAGRDKGGEGLIFNVSRGVLYAAPDSENPAEAAREAAVKYRDAINVAFEKLA